jgi:hypothetical protein
VVMLLSCIFNFLSFSFFSLSISLVYFGSSFSRQNSELSYILFLQMTQFRVENGTPTWTLLQRKNNVTYTRQLTYMKSHEPFPVVQAYVELCCALFVA